MKEIELLRNISIQNRHTYQVKQIGIQKARDRILEHSTRILGYDSTTGNYQVQNANGQIFSARAISNSSALCKGANVSLVAPVGGIPIIDAMPR
ncbi:hypothetical protein [Iningainema tapete]|uniref:Uncharacterized protein n=1 Tax=Iningainema tapete BLCC-T55 TaxID=2748662 RepID=A0A8J7BW60_9CYAN|nr:hypothetical protein [Iningainema tapete]MBD2771182.1 hypothetical protein [Iningainema tapete BLCC-T55]